MTGSYLSCQCSAVQHSAVQCRLICQTKIGVETCGCILFILHTERSVTRTIHPNSIQKENMHNRVLASHLQLIMIDVSVRLKLRQITLISSPPIHQSGLSRWRVADNALSVWAAAGATRTPDTGHYWQARNLSSKVNISTHFQPRYLVV